ncbi:phage baseplate protein [Streptomyces umbrinus]|uniref:phage baseplate protein n=2 Tax=Streptomyces umbrinus TaxID=67370 RepID=UPI0033D3B941
MQRGAMSALDRPNSRINRRTLLKAGGAAAVGLGATVLGATPASASVPVSMRFVLGGTGGNPIWKRSLHANWVLQSFGYDSVNDQIYFLQHNSTNTSAENFGDIWVTRTDLAGNETGSMALHGFGHGVSVAVEPYNGKVYLWTETLGAGDDNEGFYGTRMGRFEFINGAVFERNDSRIQDRTPTISDVVRNPQPVIDPSTNRLLVRYSNGTQRRIVAFDLSDARAGRLADADRLIERALPDPVATHQGFAAYGSFAYLLEGGTNSASYLRTIDLNDVGSSVVETFETTAGQSLPAREPEGMSIWLAPEPRLCFGFESNTGGVRQASVFFKDQRVW